MAWEWRHPVEVSECYFDQVYHTAGGQNVCILRVGGVFYVSPTIEGGSERDIGPYATLEEAQLAAEMLHGMGAFEDIP